MSRKPFIPGVAVVLWLVLLCTALPVRASSSAPSAAEAPVRVAASFALLADLVRQVGGGRVAVESLVPADADAHVFRPGPGTVRTLAQAQLFVVNGLDFEGWMTRLVRSSGYKGPVVVASQGIKPLQTRADGHRHDRHGHHHAVDPHAWQDVANVQHYVANITEGLCQVAPASCAAFRDNARRYRQTLDDVDREIRRLLAAVPPERRRVLTSHDAFAYFGQAYGITFIAPVGISTEAEPSAATVARLIREIRARNVHAFFVDNLKDTRLVDRITAETGGVRSGRLYADTLTGPDSEPIDYTAMMLSNARALARALGGEAAR